MIELVISLFVTVGLVALGFGVGRVRERRHLAELDRREAASPVVVVDVKTPPPGVEPAAGTLVMGEVVIAADYFKSFAAMFRNILGGEVKTYQSMLNRARREAKLRMADQAQAVGADLVVNVRFEWSDVGPRIPSAEIFCYGTAIVSPRS